jgi:hypothetical protein
MARECLGQEVSAHARSPDLTLALSQIPRGAQKPKARGPHVVGDGTRGAASAARSCSIWVSTGLGGRLSSPRASRDL